jgi:hypothetical protein
VGGIPTYLPAKNNARVFAKSVGASLLAKAEVLPLETL